MVTTSPTTPKGVVLFVPEVLQALLGANITVVKYFGARGAGKGFRHQIIEAILETEGSGIDCSWSTIMTSREIDLVKERHQRAAETHIVAPGEEVRKNGGLLDDAFIVKILGEAIVRECHKLNVKGHPKQRRFLFIDGAPRSVGQSIAFNMLEGTKQFSLYCRISKEMSVERAARRFEADRQAKLANPSHKGPRDDDRPEKVLFAWEQFLALTKPAIELDERVHPGRMLKVETYDHDVDGQVIAMLGHIGFTPEELRTFSERMWDENHNACRLLLGEDIKKVGPLPAVVTKGTGSITSPGLQRVQSGRIASFCQR